mmetsp:Transcript_45363/g.98430  ORF Transcript_45363/g.98430 Transcript_45363/m.98430 type:complete len:129 (+) Transcript_45363:26-412(+)
MAGRLLLVCKLVQRHARPVQVVAHSRFQIHRAFSATPGRAVQRKVDEFQEAFAEARLCLDDARESAGTAYFAEDIQEAKEAVDGCLEQYATLMKELEGPVKDTVDNANGMKIRQLQEELNQLLHEDHD